MGGWRVRGWLCVRTAHHYNSHAVRDLAVQVALAAYKLGRQVDAAPKLRNGLTPSPNRVHRGHEHGLRAVPQELERVLLEARELVEHPLLHEAPVRVEAQVLVDVRPGPLHEREDVAGAGAGGQRAGDTARS